MKHRKSEDGPRKSKSKKELIEDIARRERIDRQRALAKTMFPFVADLPTIYDAQTVMNALAGYIEFGFKKKAQEITVAAAMCDFSKEEDGPLKSAVVALHGLLEHEPAEDAVTILKRFGDGLPQFVAGRGLKEPMSTIKMDDFIA